MNTIMWILGFVLTFIGLYLVLFTEKFLSYDSKRLPNFWDPHGVDIVLLNWKSRRRITIIIGIIFLLAGLVMFFNIYYYIIQTRIA